ncbi:MAG: tRNA pseudouridine(55) synthase TruB [Clostridia bacterium]|nr:tRNA pseudouridine(55) synthase TruB [Clostridia bacterium]
MLEGVVNVLKPPGLTSSDVVSDIRHIFDIKRVGHTGTLDPGAAGVLPICIGRATRLFDYLVDKEKEYIGEIAFGIATDTQDSYGQAVERMDAVVTADMIKAVLPYFTGLQNQTAPLYSALSVGGRKMYRLAREGVEVERKVREINVPALELITQTAQNRYLVRIVCSKGTYVRTLCHDIGQRIGVPAHMSFLLRTRSGAFGLDGAFTIGELRALKEQGRLAEAVTSIEQSLMHIGEARMELNAKGERFLTHGAEVVFPGVEKLPVDTPLRGYCNGKFLGIAKSNGEAVHICTFLGEDSNE